MTKKRNRSTSDGSEEKADTKQNASQAKNDGDDRPETGTGSERDEQEQIAQLQAEIDRLGRQIQLLREKGKHRRRKGKKKRRRGGADDGEDEGEEEGLDLGEAGGKEEEDVEEKKEEDEDGDEGEEEEKEDEDEEEEEDAEEESEEEDEEEEEESEEDKKKKLLQLSKQKAKKKKRRKENKLKRFFASLNNIGMAKQRHMLIQSMGTMLNAGLSVVETLKTLELEAKKKHTKKIVHRIKEGVQTGTPLWQAMDEQYLFTPYEIALVRIGEEAGNLAKNVEYLAEQQQKDHELKSKVKMAMIYPTIVLILMFIIIMGLGMFVLPNLIGVLESLNADLPLLTRVVIQITEMFKAHGAVVAPSIIAGIIVLIILSKFTRFKTVAQWVIFKIPGIGSLAKEATIARFGVILGGLLRAGVPLVEALASLEQVTHVSAYKKFYGKLLKHISDGDSFSTSFKEIKHTSKLLPVTVQQLVVTGEQSGTLSKGLLQIADIYEQKASETAEKLPTILEPMLLLFIGALVGTIAFAIITPIYDVVGNVGRETPGL